MPGRARRGPRRCGASFEHKHQLGSQRPWNLSFNPSYEYIDLGRRPAADVRDIRRVQVGLVVDQNSRRLKAGAN